MDLNYEQSALHQEIAEFGQPYCIIAKSAGAVVTLKGIAQGQFQPAKAVLLGTAIGLISHKDTDWLKQINCPLLFIHNSQDPVASYNELKDFMAAHVKQAEFVELSGDTHDYEDYAKLQQLIGDFING